MPKRFLEESICTSESLARLSWFEQCLFFRLIVLADDYGRFFGHASIIKGAGFPLNKVSERDIDKGLSHMAELGMIILYENNAKMYLQLSSWQNHQSIRAQKSKFPNPDDSASKCLQMIANDCNCTQMRPYSYSYSYAYAYSNNVCGGESATADNAFPDDGDLSQESKAAESKASVVSDVVAYLNEKTGMAYRASTKATAEKIKARMNEGYKLDDFKSVIDKKCAEWLNTDMAKYLRPETLFGPKFEGYLNAPVKQTQPEETDYQRYQREMKDEANWSAW